MNCRYTEVGDKSGHLSEETKKLLSDGMKGRYLGENNPMYGKDWRQGKTLEELQQHSINKSNSLKGLLIGERNGMYGKTSPFKGKVHTEEVKSVMSEKRKEWFRNNMSKNSKLVLNLETGIFYNSAKEASSVYGYKYTTLKSQLNGTVTNRSNMIYC